MNKKEILNMSAGREIDILVLRDVMKYKPVFVEEGSIFGTPGELDHWYDENGVFVMLGTSPSKDISDAWKVLEFLSQKYECSTAAGREYPYKREIYVARMVGGLYQYDNPDLRLYAFANTAPLAICRVALLTLEAK